MLRTTILAVAALALLAAPDSAAGDHATGTATTERVSVSDSEAQSNRENVIPRLSADGRYVVFSSHATNLVASDTNAAADVFVRDRLNGTTRRASLSSNGVQGNFGSFPEAITPDGRYVLLTTWATTLFPADVNSGPDVVVRDMRSGTTIAVGVSTEGVHGDAGSGGGGSISADGRFVAFGSDSGNLVPGGHSGATQVYLRDLTMGTTSLLTAGAAGEPGNRGSGYGPAISADGKWVAFGSDATNLVSDNDTNGREDIFVRDLTTGAIRLVSAAHTGGAGNARSSTPSISGDGRYVAFASSATDLIPNDTNGNADVFVHDLTTRQTIRVSVASAGGQGNGHSGAPHLTHGASISGDGRYIAFLSDASNLVDRDTNRLSDVFVHDRLLHITTLASVSSTGAQMTGHPALEAIDITADGGHVVFTSRAANLVPGDTNAHEDVFVRSMPTGLGVAFTDRCDGVSTTVTNLAAQADVVSLIRHRQGVDPLEGVPGQTHLTLQPGQTHSAHVAPVDARGFSLLWQSDSVADIGDGLHSWQRPADCPGLPVTGDSFRNQLSFAAALIAAGLILLYTARRRARASSG